MQIRNHAGHATGFQRRAGRPIGACAGSANGGRESGPSRSPSALRAVPDSTWPGVAAQPARSRASSACVRPSASASSRALARLKSAEPTSAFKARAPCARPCCGHEWPAPADAATGTVCLAGLHSVRSRSAVGAGTRAFCSGRRRMLRATRRDLCEGCRHSTQTGHEEAARENSGDGHECSLHGIGGRTASVAA